MADAGHEATDKILASLERKIAKEYGVAVKDMQKKLVAYLEKTEKQRLEQEALLEAGKITSQEYKDWCFRHTMMGKRWEEMRNVLAADMHHANQIALRTSKSAMPDVYAVNANYATYQIEHDAKIDTGFTLYSHDTAEYLLGDQRQLMPGPSSAKAALIAANKDMQWNEGKIQSAVLQGILQGESPYDVAKRLMQVGQMNYNAAVRYARTMTTSAQNAGRYEAFHRADKVGVDLVIEWQATLDNRTRHDHRMMHGQRRNVDEPFETPDGFSIMYPADCSGASDAPQKEIWNCRCTLLSWVKGFEGDTVTNSPKMGDMSFEEWQQAGTKSGNNELISDENNDIIEQRGIADRNMSNGLRQSPFHVLSDDEVSSLENDAESIGVPLDLLSFNTGTQTGYSEQTGKIHVRGDILPDMNSTYARDQLSSKAVFAHEYYGHYLTRDTVLPPGDWRDEFRASYRAARITPNLSDDERSLLILDAMDRAKEAGVTIRINSTMRRMLYGLN